MAYRIFEALWGMIHKKNVEMTEEQQDEPESPSTQLDLTHVHDDRPSTQLDLTHVVKELIDKTEAMEKRLQEVEKLCKNLTAERMEGNSTNLQHSSPLLPSHDDEGDEHMSHTETC